LNKILITIQGRTLILYYQVKHGLARKDTGRAGYIEVLASDELSKFDLKGLTPEMFCVNIADMVNIRGLFAGQVENERQIPVARWTLSHEEYLQAIRPPAKNLSHRQIVNLLASLPGYLQETDNLYIDFEESVVLHANGEHSFYSGYRLTVVTEDVEGNISTYAYYNLDTRTAEGWQNILPPPADYATLHDAVHAKLQLITAAGVQITRVSDETDYALAS
jgi:hypothetical protein